MLHLQENRPSPMHTRDKFPNLFFSKMILWRNFIQHSFIQFNLLSIIYFCLVLN